ncbi:hypothetical protein ACO0RG_001257 [Hanseniaspora osmophila]
MKKTNSEAPSIIRIKRKRNEESLQALCIEQAENTDEKIQGSLSSTNKKRKVIFRLKRVDSAKKYEEAPVLKSTEQDHLFLFENQRETLGNAKSEVSQEALNPEVNDLLQEYLQQQQQEKHQNKINNDDQEYVFDVYFKEEINDDEDTFVFDKSTMGYIKIIDDPLVPEEETDISDLNALSDDQDSNEEDYYQNDYPEDEDDDRSILFGSDVSDQDSVIEDPNYTRDILVSSSGLINGDYDQAYSRMSNTGDFLDAINNEGGRTSDEYEYLESDAEYGADQEDFSPPHVADGDFEDFPRNQFFATDQDDPLAIHRDKVMYKLQKMINKK